MVTGVISWTHVLTGRTYPVSVGGVVSVPYDLQWAKVGFTQRFPLQTRDHVARAFESPHI